MGESKKALTNADQNPGEESDVFCEDEFLDLESLDGLKRGAAERTLRQALGDIEEMFREKRWEDIVALYFPVEEKAPEISAHGMDLELRLKVAFAMGHLKRFDEAIDLLFPCVESDPQSFALHSALGYTAYNSLYAAKKREIFLSGKSREDRLLMAHSHLQKAQELRPDGITAYYREGMLYRQIEAKPQAAVPFLARAVTNWEGLSEEERGRRRQERKNFIRALYNLAGALLDTGKAKKARVVLKRCLNEDRESDYLSPLFKYFALGKVEYHLNCFAQARDALVFAAARAEEPVDFVSELLARTHLAMGEPAEALDVIRQVPERLRRPYYRWTEADAYCAIKRFEKARRVLIQAKERDGRSKHKTLIRLAKIEYLLGRFAAAAGCSSEALRFFSEKWGTPYEDGLFWLALSLFRLGELEKARQRALELHCHNPRYPRLHLLLGKLKSAATWGEEHGKSVSEE